MIIILRLKKKRNKNLQIYRYHIGIPATPSFRKRIFTKVTCSTMDTKQQEVTRSCNDTFLFVVVVVEPMDFHWQVPEPGAPPLQRRLFRFGRAGSPGRSWTWKPDQPLSQSFARLVSPLSSRLRNFAQLFVHFTRTFARRKWRRNERRIERSREFFYASSLQSMVVTLITMVIFEVVGCIGWWICSLHVWNEN